MLRKRIFRKLHADNFTNRGAEILRIEALSDAVFAFSVSLLVASLEVPQTFDELKNIVRGAIPFFATVAIIFLLWYQQYIFFRRYGLNDFKIVLLNMIYLAIILFYVYPLKFMFSILISSWTGLNLFPKAIESGETILTTQEFPELIMLFSIGYCLIWLVLYLMHKRALKKSVSLGLNKYEFFYTKKELNGAIMNAAIGAIAFILAWLHIAWLSGLTYLLIPVVIILNERNFKSRMRLIEKQLN
ncbi:MAG: TMEM175 family protein [Chitinophagaceae bacterium]